MPKLSHAKRHRKNLNLVAYCNHEPVAMQTPRRVSEEDIQNNDSPTSYIRTPQQQLESDFSQTSQRNSLKRPAPSTSLSEMAESHMMQEDLLLSPCAQNAGDCSDSDPNQDCTRLSPIWGHFVDVILEDEEQLLSQRSDGALRLLQHAYRNTEEEWADWPYLFACKKKQKKEQRQRIRSPERTGSSSLDGFVLQDPASLPDTILPEALARLRM